MLEKPPNVDNNHVIHSITKVLFLASFVGFVKAGESIISNL